MTTDTNRNSLGQFNYAKDGQERHDKTEQRHYTYEGTRRDLPLIGHVKKFKVTLYFDSPTLHSIRTAVVQGRSNDAI